MELKQEKIGGEPLMKRKSICQAESTVQYDPTAGVGGTPPFIAKAAGSRIFDIDGNSYIDYVGSWGPMILGSCSSQGCGGVACCTGTWNQLWCSDACLKTELAKLVRQAVPAMELMRMVNSGTEATMSALQACPGLHETRPDRQV